VILLKIPCENPGPNYLAKLPESKNPDSNGRAFTGGKIDDQQDQSDDEKQMDQASRDMKTEAQ
jgi:hypothetical protein